MHNFDTGLLTFHIERASECINTINEFNTTMRGLDIDGARYIRESRAIEALFTKLHNILDSCKEQCDECSYEHWERMRDCRIIKE